MRLSMKDDRVDYDEFEKVIDTFIANGFNHFDTALSYEGGKSETDLRDCLTSRYPQDAQLKLFSTDRAGGCPSITDPPRFFTERGGSVMHRDRCTACDIL